MQLSFGAGQLFTTVTRDAEGNAIAVPQNVEFGALQNSDLSAEFEMKKLHGNRQFALGIARGKGTINVKAKFASFNGRILGDYVFGSGSAVGVRQLATDIELTVPATPFQATVVPPLSGTFTEDLGVTNGTTGQPLTRVALADTPTTGQYSVDPATGQYTFAAADEGNTVFQNFEYTADTGGFTGSIRNILMGQTPYFSMRLNRQYDGKQLAFTFLRCSSPNFSVPGQNDDFGVSDFDIEVFSNDANLVGYWSSSE